jgi:hypothetical protein
MYLQTPFHMSHVTFACLYFPPCCHHHSHAELQLLCCVCASLLSAPCCMFCALQVTAQRDGARLLVTLESKQAERLDVAVQRFQTLLQPGLVIGVQQDVSSLSGLSGKHRSSLQLSPVRPQQQWGEVGSAQSTAEGTGVQQMCGVQQAAAAVGLVAGVDAAGVGNAAVSNADSKGEGLPS